MLSVCSFTLSCISFRFFSGFFNVRRRGLDCSLVFWPFSSCASPSSGGFTRSLSLLAHTDSRHPCFVYDSFLVTTTAFITAHILTCLVYNLNKRSYSKGRCV